MKFKIGSNKKSNKENFYFIFIIKKNKIVIS